MYPSVIVYQWIEAKLEDELASDDKLTNPPQPAAEIVKRQKLDLGLTRQLWVDGCSAALPRGDIKVSRTAPGISRGGIAATKRGRGQFTSRGGRGRGRFTSRGDRGRDDPYQFQ